MSWYQVEPHVEPVAIEAYVTQLVDSCTEVTIEQHLLECAACRMLLAVASVDGKLPEIAPERLESVWAEIAARIDDPSSPAITSRRRVRPWRTCSRKLNTHSQKPAKHNRQGILGIVATIATASMLITGMAGLVTGSQSILALDQYGTSVTGSDPGSTGATFAAMAPDRTNTLDAEPQVPCRIGSANTCDEDGVPEGSHTACSLDDVMMSLNWQQTQNGLEGKLKVANVSGAPCWLPVAPDITLVDGGGVPFMNPATTGGRPATTEDPSVLLPHGRFAVSDLVWDNWCLTTVAPAVRVGMWAYPPVDSGARPVAPTCQAGESPSFPISENFRINRPVIRGNTPV